MGPEALAILLWGILSMILISGSEYLEAPELVDTSSVGRTLPHPGRRGHQHYKSKNKVRKINGEENKDRIETEYYFENGLRKVYPYYFSFSSFVKGRWIGRTVEDVYVKEFRGKGREFLVDEIERGRITVNGKKVPPDFKLKDGQFLEHIVHRHENPVVGGPLQIIDNTPDLVVVNKPASIPCHPCSRFRYNSITFILGVEHGLKNLRTLYRLDRLTSGVLILPKTLKKSQRWEKQLANREFYKEYVCRVEGEFPEGTLTCDEPIELLSHDIFLFKVGPKGKPSTTKFTRLSYNGKSSVVKCVPLTGRSHQIRVHLQYLGYPILNDPIYNRAIYGRNKGKDGELECTVEEIAADIKNGTNIGRWKGGKNPKYAEFLAQKQLNVKRDSKITDTGSINAMNTLESQNSKGSKSEVPADIVDKLLGKEQVDKDFSIDDEATKETKYVDKKTVIKSKHHQTDSQDDTSESVIENKSQANLLGEGTSGETYLSIDSNKSESVQNSKSSVCDILLNDEKESNSNVEETPSSDERPCKRLKTDQDSSIDDCEKPSIENMKITEESCSKEAAKQDVELVTGESITIIPYEEQEFDESKMTYEENCEECMYLYKDPTPTDLVLYLHAVRYKGPDWDYSAPLPDWADPDWTQEGC